MARPTVSNFGRLDTTVNVPVATIFKKKLVSISNRLPGKPPHTRVARAMLELCAKQVEKEGITQLATAVAQ